MVAAAIGVPFRSVETTVDGDLDLAGTLGLSKDVQVGFEAIQLRITLDAPDAEDDQLAALRRLTERYCVVMQTLASPPEIGVEWKGLYRRAKPGEGLHPEIPHHSL
jgi:uncharacterized OsmC-like protein